jgi:hypothetical protein
VILDGHDRGVLVPASLAPAIVRLIREGWHEVAIRDGLIRKMPTELARLVDELDAVSSSMTDRRAGADDDRHDR